MNAVQAKQNSFDNLSTAHGDLQAWFNTLKNSMDTLDKQQLVRRAAEAMGEVAKYKVDLAQTNEILKEMLHSQCQFNYKMDICNTMVKVLLLDVHNLISGEAPQYGMEPEAAQAMIKVLGYQKIADGKPLWVHSMPGTQEGWDWLLWPDL